MKNILKRLAELDLRIKDLRDKERDGVIRKETADMLCGHASYERRGIIFALEQIGLAVAGNPYTHTYSVKAE